MKRPDLLLLISKQLGRRIVNEVKNRLIIFLVILSAKLLPKPLGGILLGASSSGKSEIMKASANNFPEGITMNIDCLEFRDGFGVVSLTDLTFAALFRIAKISPNFFHQKCLLMYELPEKASDEQVRVQQLLRVLISEGKINRMITLENKDLGFLELSGYPAFISADANYKVEEQLRNRLLTLNPDESDWQTTNVCTKQAEIETDPFLYLTVENSSDILESLHPELDSLHVINPYAPTVTKLLLDKWKSPQMRRLNKLVLNTVRVVTLLHQHQRHIYRHEKDQSNSLRFVLTEEIDVVFTLWLLSEVLEQTMSQLVQSALKVVKTIKEVTETVRTDDDGIEISEYKWFTSAELREHLTWSKAAINNHLKNLAESGYLDRDKKGRAYVYRLLKEPTTNSLLIEHHRPLVDYNPDLKDLQLPEGYISLRPPATQGGSRAIDDNKRAIQTMVWSQAIGDLRSQEKAKKPLLSNSGRSWSVSGGIVSAFTKSETEQKTENSSTTESQERPAEKPAADVNIDLAVKLAAISAFNGRDNAIRKNDVYGVVAKKGLSKVQLHSFLKQHPDFKIENNFVFYTPTPEQSVTNQLLLGNFTVREMLKNLEAAPGCGKKEEIEQILNDLSNKGICFAPDNKKWKLIADPGILI